MRGIYALMVAGLLLQIQPEGGRAANVNRPKLASFCLSRRKFHKRIALRRRQSGAFKIRPNSNARPRSEFHFGIPCVRWLQSLVNRVDPVLFGRCFESWIKQLWPDRHDLIAIDGKTSRRTHDKRKGLKALHTLSAYASNARLVLGQLSVPEKTNEPAIPVLLDHFGFENDRAVCVRRSWEIRANNHGRTCEYPIKPTRCRFGGYQRVRFSYRRTRLVDQRHAQMPVPIEIRHQRF
jgi:hypothetical protein